VFGHHVNDAWLARCLELSGLVSLLDLGLDLLFALALGPLFLGIKTGGNVVAVPSASKQVGSMLKRVWRSTKQENPFVPSRTFTYPVRSSRYTIALPEISGGAALSALILSSRGREKS
jgi:hypothetical protein